MDVDATSHDLVTDRKRHAGRPLVAHYHLGLRNRYRQTGHQAKTEDRLVTAVTMYRDMG